MVQLGLAADTCSSATASLFSGLALGGILLGHANLWHFPGIHPSDSVCSSSSSVQLGPLYLPGIAPPAHLGSVVRLGQPHLRVGGHSGVQLGSHSWLGLSLHHAEVQLGWHSPVQLGLYWSLVKLWLMWAMV